MTSNTEILHIFNDQKKFSKDFFIFLKDNNFDLSKHYLFHYGKDDGFYEKFPMRYSFGGSFFSFWGGIKLFILLFQPKKIVIHSLASPYLLLYLWLFPFLNKKVYWVIWGKDLYFYQTLDKKRFHHKLYEFFRKRVIKNIKNIVTGNAGDFELAKLWYKSDAKRIDCFVYPSNLYRPLNVSEKNDNVINILAGNSADSSNKHEEIFNVLKPFVDRNIKIYCPLSYGEKDYAKRIAILGSSIFGEKFIPLMNFMPYEDYMKLLAKIDIAVFNHRRQQAFGTKVALLGSGKKVYLSEHSTLWSWFSDRGIKVFNVESFNLDPISSDKAENNIKVSENYFSEKNLNDSLRLWLE